MSFLNKKIINSGERHIGLDLSDLSVKVFQLEKKGSLHKIRSYNTKEIRAGLIKDGKIIDKVQVGKIIAEAVKQAGPKKINTKKVISSIPETKVFLRMISIPKMSEEEASEAVKWELEASIPLSVDQVYYDWQFLDETDGKQNILTVAAARETVDDLLETLELAGLTPVGIELESIASVRSLVPQNSNKVESFFVIDIGSDETSFIIAQGSVPYFTSSIPFSSFGLTDVISKTFNSTREEAEKIKISRGIEHFSGDSTIFNSVKPFLENLSVEIEKTIDFYQNMSKSKDKIEKIIVSGGGANLKGLVPYLAARLRRDIYAGDPWVNLNLGKNLPPINKENSTRYATVIGLAMRRINYGN
jgi:type IV pilus assembly protein PilM